MRSALDITNNCECHSNFLPGKHFQKDEDGLKFSNNASVFNNFLLSEGITLDEQVHNLKTIEPTKENTKNIHLIGNYACNTSTLANNNTDQLTEPEVDLYLEECRLGLLNASLSNIVQRIWKIKKQCWLVFLMTGVSSIKRWDPMGGTRITCSLMNWHCCDLLFVLALCPKYCILMENWIQFSRALPLKVSAIWIRR